MGDVIVYDGQTIPVRAGQSVAAALWQAGIRSWRRTRVASQPRGLFCGVGACFDCLATVDGVPGQRACLAPARPGTVVTSNGTGSGDRASATAVDTDSASTTDTVSTAGSVSAVGSVSTAGSVSAVGSAAGSWPLPSAPHYDVAVVGAGPAGLAAAATAALGGTRVVLLDSEERPGGQFWRHRDPAAGRGQGRWSVFSGLASIVEERVDHIAGAAVWFVERTGGSGWTPIVLHTTAGRFEAHGIVLATGAYDRVLPFPGWDLPGVVTPGAVHALLRGSGVAIGREVVVAGAGPFLLPVAASLASAGVRVVGVYEAGDPRRYLRHPSAFTGIAGRMGEAAAYAATLASRRIPYRIRHAVVAAHGDGAVSGVDVARLDDGGRIVAGSVERVACDAVAVGYGFTANLDLALAVGCATRVGADGGLAVVAGVDGQTSVAGVYAAGEITGVGGASLALVEGELAGSAAAQAAGAGAPLSRRDVASLRRRRSRLRAFADAMHAAHAVPPGWPDWLDDQTLVCRCEEVPYAAVAAAVNDLGATDARAVKLLARPGMGWCQGRVCGHATADLTARLCGRAVTAHDLAAFAGRAFAAPVRLADLATDG